MPDPTYCIAYLTEDIRPPESLPIQADGIANLAVFNGQGSNVNLRIQAIDIKNMMGAVGGVSPAFPNLGSIYFITALSGGSDIPALKMDTSTANLPSQIQIIKNASSTTISSTIRRIMFTPEFNLTRASNDLGVHDIGEGAIDNSNIWGGIDTNLQGLILNEGQGLSFNIDILSAPLIMELNLVFTTADGTYYVQRSLGMYSNGPVFAIFNGSGSGRVITIKTLCLSEIGDDTQPLFSLEIVDGIEDSYSEDTDVNILKMDTSSPNLPSQISIKQFAKVRSGGSVFGATGFGNIFRRNIKPVSGIGPGIGNLNFRNSESLDNLAGEILIRQGQGLAIFKRNYSALGIFGIFMQITKEDIPTGGISKSRIIGGA